MTTGRFIALEGGEAVGKSTQARRLAAALRERGLDIVETREPGGSAGAEAIRGLLMRGEADRWSAPAEALLFAAARADHVSRTIRPALEAGRWVVCDRFVHSSLAYQGIAGSVGEAQIRALHDVGSGGLLPDRVLLLQLDPDEAARRMGQRDGASLDRFGARDQAFHRAVANAFAALAAADPDRFRTVSAEGEEDEVTARLIASVEDML
ncbi:MAG TPA: dTMP kinase [Allosphingosinicella sp.]|nr:dTMP kinase [Allosphingosinicella sp.]